MDIQFNLQLINFFFKGLFFIRAQVGMTEFPPELNQYHFFSVFRTGEIGFFHEELALISAGFFLHFPVDLEEEIIFQNRLF